MKLISAMTPSGIIGANNTIPWNQPEDLRRFKQLTDGSVLIMGKNTFYSLPKKLPNRTSIVVSEVPVEKADHTFDNFHNAINFAKSLNKQVWIAGGGSIYKQALENNVVNHIELTIVPEINQEGLSDVVYFPVALLANFKLTSELMVGNLKYRTYVVCN
jgi:dihydrofolate reductase